MSRDYDHFSGAEDREDQYRQQMEDQYEQQRHEEEMQYQHEQDQLMQQRRDAEQECERIESEISYHQSIIDDLRDRQQDIMRSV